MWNCRIPHAGYSRVIDQPLTSLRKYEHAKILNWTVVPCHEEWFLNTTCKADAN